MTPLVKIREGAAKLIGQLLGIDSHGGPVTGVIAPCVVIQHDPEYVRPAAVKSQTVRLQAVLLAEQGDESAVSDQIDAWIDVLSVELRRATTEDGIGLQLDAVDAPGQFVVGAAVHEGVIVRLHTERATS